MADPGAADAAAVYREMFEAWLKLSADAADRTLQAVDLDRRMRAAGSLSTAAQQTFGEAIGRVLTGMNLPNRAEILEIGAAVAALDARLERIEALLEGLNGPPLPPAPKPPRTRQP